MKKKSARKNNHRAYSDLGRVKIALSRVSRNLKHGANHLMRNSLNQARNKSLELQGDLSAYVSRKPLKSLSIALVTGAVIGFFMHHR